MSAFSLFVRGVPAPKGSMRAFMPKGHRVPIVTSGRSAPARAWQAAVTSALQERWEGPPLEGPVVVILDFQLLKPPSAPKKRLYPTVKPDVDKCARAVLDAMTKVVFRDDAQVVDLHAFKSYAYESGVLISVKAL